jgi:hypothetical protein
MTLKIRTKRIIRKIVRILTPTTDQEYYTRQYRQYRANHNPPTCGDLR